MGWNQCEKTFKCIESIRTHTPRALYQITYIDNGSSRQVADYWIRNRFPDVNYVALPFNHGFVRGTNVGIALSLLTDSEYILLLNNDTEITLGDTRWLERLIAPMLADSTIGAVGAVSNNVYGHQRRDAAKKIEVYHFVSSLIGFCLLLRKQAVIQTGLLDEQFEPGNFEDFDYSIRLRKAGYKLAVAESVFIHHVMHASFKELDKKESFNALLETNKRKLLNKWGAAELEGVGL